MRLHDIFINPFHRKRCAGKNPTNFQHLYWENTQSYSHTLSGFDPNPNLATLSNDWVAQLRQASKLLGLSKCMWLKCEEEKITPTQIPRAQPTSPTHPTHYIRLGQTTKPNPNRRAVSTCRCLAVWSENSRRSSSSTQVKHSSALLQLLLLCCCWFARGTKESAGNCSSRITVWSSIYALNASWSTILTSWCLWQTNVVATRMWCGDAGGKELRSSTTLPREEARKKSQTQIANE